MKTKGFLITIMILLSLGLLSAPAYSGDESGGGPPSSPPGRTFTCSISPNSGQLGTALTFNYHDCGINSEWYDFRIIFQGYEVTTEARILSFTNCTLTVEVPRDAEIGFNHVVFYAARWGEEEQYLCGQNFTVLEPRYITAQAEGHRTSPNLIPSIESSCSVVNNPDGSVLFSCPDGTSATVDIGTTCRPINNPDGSITFECSDGTSTTVDIASPCTVSQIPSGGVSFECPDGTTATVENGEPCTITDNINGSVTIDCNNGGIATVAKVGGGAGTSCSVTKFSDGRAVISCPDGTSATVYDGEPGTCECSSEPPVITHDAPTSVYTDPTILINISITDEQELAYFAIQDEQEPANNTMMYLDPTVASTSFVLEKSLIEGSNKVIIIASDMEGNMTKSLIDINAALASCIPVGDPCDFLTEMDCCGYPDTVCISDVCTTF